MRRKKIWGVTLMAFMVLALPALAQKGKKPKRDDRTIPGSVTFRDCKDGLPSVAFALLHLETAYQLLCPTPNDRFRSDGKGSYTDNDADIRAFVTRDGGFFRFRLLTKKSQPATRRAFVDFSDCAPRETCTVDETTPLPPGFKSPTFSSLLGGDASFNLFSVGSNFIEMPVGVPEDLKLEVGFLRWWTVSFAGRQAFAASCPATDTVSVERTAADTWVIEADRNDIACLTEFKGGAQARGLYHMPFKITFVCEDPSQCVAPPSLP